MGNFDPSRDHVRVSLHDVEVQAAVGLHPWERHPQRPTRLIVNIEMFAYLVPGAKTPFIDYDRLRDFLKTLEDRAHTDLLETLIDEVMAQCFADPVVDACRVAIAKPDIFNEARAAEVSLFRARR